MKNLKKNLWSVLDLNKSLDDIVAEGQWGDEVHQMKIEAYVLIFASRK